MKFVADLHIHSKFSRATSRDMTLDSIAHWAKVKGISLMATGDFTHPEWLFLAKEKLVPTGNGFFQLKNLIPSNNEYLEAIAVSPGDVSFILSTEISFIYSKKGRVRKIHILLLSPDFESIEKINTRLSGIGNLRSDGRPILGLDAKDFVKIVTSLCPRCVVIPAHIWTPWFSLFGANSGFDIIEDCFEEMTPHIFALETGLSSDPSMNWRCSQLDKYSLISNSDAHSPSRIGREANVFDTEFSYSALIQAIKRKDPEEFLNTVEFFPEEGKYHYDGHRNCGIVFSPEETIQHKGLCPECGKKLTIGVMHRITELADREPGQTPSMRIPYKNLIPLNEIIAQAIGKTAGCKSVWDIYFRYIHEFGDEHTILTEIPISQLRQMNSERIALGIERMRQGKVKIIPGHDGTYGIINLFDEDSPDATDTCQLKLF
ncbi:MAG: endonuclease Q family protein [Candidatus Aminicenantes bacterium]